MDRLIGRCFPQNPRLTPLNRMACHALPNRMPRLTLLNRVAFVFPPYAHSLCGPPHKASPRRSFTRHPVLITITTARKLAFQSPTSVSSISYTKKNLTNKIPHSSRSQPLRFRTFPSPTMAYRMSASIPAETLEPYEAVSTVLTPL
jgi:hypothetical protein